VPSAERRAVHPERRPKAGVEGPALLILLLLAAPAFAAKVEKLAAPGWTVVNISPELANFYANEVARTLKTHGLKVVTASDIAAVLGNERQKQLLGCADDSTNCMVELGAALGCDGLLVANLARLGDVYRGSLKVVSAQDGSTLAEQPVDASSESRLLDALGEAANKLGRTLNPPPPRDVRAFALIPLLTGVATAAGCAAGFGVAVKNLHDIPDQPNEAAAQELARGGQTAEAVGWVMAGVTAAALTTAALVYFLSDRPAVTPTVTVSPNGAGAGVSVRF
jgi:hypothetical protein